MFDRRFGLFSAYRDKAVYQFRGDQAEKVLHYYKKLGEEYKFEAYDIESFHKFIQYVIASNSLKKTGESGPDGIRERHWTPYSEICNFCDVKYDFIGKLETVTGN